MIIYVAFSIFILCLLVIITMFVSLGKQGDERRKMIIGKTSANSFIVMALYLLICVIERAINSFAQGLSSEEINPLIMLTILSMVYTIQLLYFKRKYGN